MRVLVFGLLLSLAGLLVATAGIAGGPPPVGSRVISEAAVDGAVARLVAIHGPSQTERIRRGVTQVAQRWWEEDGDEAAFAAFCETSFIAEPSALAATFARLERVLEQIDGHLHEVRRELLTPSDLDTGPVTAADRLFADFDLSVHTDDDLFKTKVAFLALLNFPVHTLGDRLVQGGAWSR